MGWVIYDVGFRRPYVPRVWASKEEGSRELEDLLRPYPADHVWRQRLVVRAWASLDPSLGEGEEGRSIRPKERFVRLECDLSAELGGSIEITSALVEVSMNECFDGARPVVDRGQG